MFFQTKLKYEAASFIITNGGQGLILIDAFSKLNEKFVEGLYLVLHMPGGATGGASNTGIAVSEIVEDNLQGILY